MKASFIKFQNSESKDTFLPAPDIEVYGSMVVIAPLIRNLGIRWRLSASILRALLLGIVPDTH
jgi:hypothetical protein